MKSFVLKAGAASSGDAFLASLTAAAVARQDEGAAAGGGGGGDDDPGPELLEPGKKKRKLDLGTALPKTHAKQSHGLTKLHDQVQATIQLVTEVVNASEIFSAQRPTCNAFANFQALARRRMLFAKVWAAASCKSAEQYVVAQCASEKQAAVAAAAAVSSEQ